MTPRSYHSVLPHMKTSTNDVLPGYVSTAACRAFFRYKLYTSMGLRGVIINLPTQEPDKSVNFFPLTCSTCRCCHLPGDRTTPSRTPRSLQLHRNVGLREEVARKGERCHRLENHASNRRQDHRLVNCDTLSPVMASPGECYAYTAFLCPDTF